MDFVSLCFAFLSFFLVIEFYCFSQNICFIKLYPFSISFSLCLLNGWIRNKTGASPPFERHMDVQFVINRYAVHLSSTHV